MKLQNLTVIFIIIILPIILVLSAYIGYEIKTINKQNMYNTGVVSATHDAIFSFELNTKNDVYNNNAESKRSNIKAAVKTFENSLSTSCNLDLYNNEEIEEYIPAIVFGLYDGFYMYAPSELTQDGIATYKHNLRNYVYYSEPIKTDKIDIVIIYTLDNYVAVSGTIDGKYVVKSGYLTNLNKCEGYSYTVKAVDEKLGEADLTSYFKYQGVNIKTKETLSTYTYVEDEGSIENNTTTDDSAINYFKESIAFSKWFEWYISSVVPNEYSYLKIDNSNDPEKEDAPFVQHKRKVMKEKIEQTLNSSITAYANRTRNNYKMPKFSEEDWEKIYNNISVISFVQGMNLGFKNYNNYCILNSTNNQEYVNPNLIYFTDGDSYHNIRCEDAKEELTGYKIGSFEKIKYDVTDGEGEVTDTNYYYKHNELACYSCINGSDLTNVSLYEYVRDSDTDPQKRSAYFSALARERYKTTKLLEKTYGIFEKLQYTLEFNANASEDDVSNMPDNIKVNKGEIIDLTNLSEPIREGYIFKGWNENKKATSGNVSFDNDYRITKDTILYAIWEQVEEVEEKVAKIGETYYSSLSEAIENAENGDTIDLLKSVTSKKRIEISKTVKLEGNGYQITTDGIVVSSSGNLTLNNINIVKTPGVISLFICNYGDLKINGGKYITYGYAVIVNGDGTLTINEGTFERREYQYSNYDAAIIQSGSGTTYINGGTIISDKNGVAVTSLNSGKMFIKSDIWDNNITYGEGYGQGYCNARYALQIVD